MLTKDGIRRWGLVLVAVLVAALFVARHLTDRGESPGAGRPAGDLPAGELSTYSAREAAGHVGEIARVCGVAVDASYVPGTDGRPTFLNLGEPYPDPLFTVVIWGEDRRRFDAPPERAYRDRRICVTGRIRSYEGRPEIIVTRPAQIRIAPEAGSREQPSSEGSP